MIVPEDDCQLALSLSQLLARSSFESAQGLLSVPTSELEMGAKIVLELLRESPLNTRALFRAVPQGVVRSLGEEGRRMGYPSTLMMVMKFLEAQGLVGVWPEGDRIDGVLHRWDLLEPKVQVIGDSSTVIHQLILRYIGLSGASTVSGFSNWSGLGVEQSKHGFEKLDLHPFRVEGREVVYADESTATQLLGGVPQVPKSLALPLEDPLFGYREGLSALLDQDHNNISVTVSGRGVVSLGDLHRVPFRPILIEGSLGGFWEYDDEEQVISYTLFDRMRGGDLRRLELELEALADWLFSSFGHAKAHHSESLRSRRDRLRSVQALKGQQ